MNLKTLLGERLQAALRDAGAAAAPAIVGPATRPEFGDYQANGALAAAKRLGMKPRDLASRVAEVADLSGIAARCEVTGPGFISLTIDDDCLSEALADGRIEPVGGGERVVIDYSHPNLAKEMQVHHLRSTIIGDAVARVLEALGYDVIRQNHVGDWGTGFGRLVAHLNDIGEDSEALGDLERFYTDASARFAADAAFADRARQVVVDLQGGDPETLARWRRYIDISMSHCQTVYDRLGVGLKAEHIRGESAYNDDLDGIVEDLLAKGLLTESDGALCAFLPEFEGKDGKVAPIIVRKSDGGYLYHSTDLAAVRYRTETLHAKRVLYVVDARQSLHFKQLFALAKRASYDGGASLEHHPFGAMLGPDGRPFKTREGGGTRLLDLLDEATARARQLVEAKNPELDGEEMDRVARAVGIGAVKYADISKNRTGDYVFDWNAMMSFEGNTAPYLQYAYARIQSLFQRGQVDPASLEGKPAIGEPEEHALALQLARFQETLEQVAASVMPHHLCTYLYDLASAFMRFYERCPVLDSEFRNDRLLLCRHTAATLSRGLDLLGIETVDRM
ncbi:MAG: arginine--tRNA ligase [Gammaproteobacteria bacterium]|nr:arginine--tRNA ligase [Gammaproteobacteria bacterium]